jgi:hypothetical protein
MSKKKKPAHGVGQVVEGEILTMLKIDWSDCIGDTQPEEWTRGPVRPVTGEDEPGGNKGRQAASRKKRKRPS